MLKKLIAAVIVVLIAGGAGFWWFVLRDDPAPKLSVDDGGSTETTVGKTPAVLDGTWKIDEGSSTAGLRIKESFGNGLVDHVAVGRSKAVTGSIALAGSKVTTGSFTVDLTKIEFTDSPPFPVANRANAMRSRGLETDQFPTASFEVTTPIDLGAKPVAGKTVTASVTGDLTLHGAKRSVTFDVEAKLVGDTIRVATKDPVEIALADYDIQKPTGGPVAAISDTGSFEFLAVFTK